MTAMFDLTGKIALITGSSRGIGKAIAEAYARQGAKVIITSRKLDACEAVAAQINEENHDAPGEAMAIACNVSDVEQLTSLVDRVKEEWGRIDILVCNAAVNPYHGPMSGIDDGAWEKILQVNVTNVLKLCNMVLPDMAARRDGAVILISSVGGLKGSINLGAYAVSKAADMQLARNLAVEWGPHNVRANAIAPGLIKTDFARALWENPEARARAEAAYPLGRLGEPEDIAGTAILLASDAGSFITGQTFVVDGGGVAAGNRYS
ncbi:MAG TPA: short-chain dehydrogenase [Rhodospirillaceae bacterium]|nr:short-chain dehydrogenase [Magnetovibrio sp.]HBT43114.1 short-chain dehydrogenase [Rhodospirillaceae bacterium]HCS71672.1 short-chain dehydrogenase [Rhodospirillaceae bacterium]|tara:strand:+ start:5468 stop:6259 length:792 start_codon:yes stop_codon:yes gene_type:complete